VMGVFFPCVVGANPFADERVRMQVFASGLEIYLWLLSDAQFQKRYLTNEAIFKDNFIIIF
jgi:hypothetical protein